MPDEESVPSYPMENILQTIFQAVIAFTTGIYTVGFVVVNSHFTKFGVADYGLVQARYIAAGLNYAAIHVGIAAMIAVIFAAFAKSPRLLLVLSTSLLWGLLGGATYVVGRQIDAALMTGVNALVISLLAYQVSTGRSKGDSHWDEEILSSYGVSRQSLLITLTVGGILLVIISTVTWGKSLWPLMGASLGGGRPASAVFAIKQDELPILD
jgi:hypothetical protein